MLCAPWSSINSFPRLATLHRWIQCQIAAASADAAIALCGSASEMDRWAGRVAIVTGASSGIGAAIARIFAENGMKVVGFARRADRVESLSEELKAAKAKGELLVFAGDVRNEQSIKDAIKFAHEKFSGLHVLVNNAGVGSMSPLTGISTEEIRKVLDTNLIGACVFAREAVKDMKANGVDDGHIFNINSIMGQSIVDYPGTYLYSAGKHGLTVVTEGLRRELRDLKTKIRVTSVSPGFTKTEIGTAAGYPEDKVDEIFNSMPCLESVDVANAVLYALAAPPHVQVHEITLHPTGELF